MPKYRVGNSGSRIEIKPGWRVLDVGSGHSPHPRADILLDNSQLDNADRAGKPIRLIPGETKFVQGDATVLPFRDASFDYIIASHVAEHVADPANFCREMMRVGKRGYIETPSKLAEILLGEPVHKWYVYNRRGILFFEKNKQSSWGIIGKIFYGIFYINISRQGHKTVSFSNRYLRSISTTIVEYLMRKPWRKARLITYTCFAWERKFDFRILAS